ncbi:ADAMTS-like protein 2 isoform X2 [Haliotis asinina]|uniref:ADAMTS-like protein 2 isoform X2 n=1 Tax=Haliotis asinina TaxID=109174 RepID=UPI003531823B
MNARQCVDILHIVTVCFVVSHSGVESRDRTKITAHEEISCDFRWSAWSEFSPCSRSCGLGMKARHRTCYEYGPDPRPVDGKNCKGKTRDQQACNTQPCSPGSRDFRELQCSFFNGQTYRGRLHQWKAFTARGRDQVSDPCALMCEAEGHSGIVVKFSQRVVDGTECGRSPWRVCVAGICVPIGCDSRPYSNKTEDHCGVCGGRNDTCHTVTKTISYRLPSGTTELLRIPVGARYVKVTERPRNGVILSLKNAQGTVSINGRTGRGHSTDTKLVAGTVVYYYHPRRGLKNIRAEGPLNDTLIVMGHTRHPSRVSLWYEYTIHNTKTKPTQGVDQGGPDNPDPSYPWQSLLYNHVVSGRGVAGTKSLANSMPIVALATSTVQPSCQRRHAVIRGKVAHDIQGKVAHDIQGKVSHGIQGKVSHGIQGKMAHGKKRRGGKTFETFHRLRGRGPSKSGRRKSFSRSHRRRVHKSSGRRKMSSRNKGSIKTVYSKGGIIKNVSRSSRNGAKKPRPFPNNVQKKGTKGSHQGIMVSKQTTTEPSQRYTTVERSTKASMKSIAKTTQYTAPVTSTPIAVGTTWNGSLTAATTTQRYGNVTTTTTSTTPQPTEVSAPFENASVASPSKRSPVEAAFPTFMPDKISGASKEDLSIASRTPGSHVGERRRRGRGRKRKKEDRFLWRANDVTPCTSTCEIGTTVTFFSCYQRTGERVDDRFCNSQTKPPPSHHTCSGRTCKPRWVAGLWSECSESCGEGRQERTARCWQMMAPGFDSTVRDFACNPDDKPQTVRSCHRLRSCVPQWEISAWEECSTECGYGVQLRHVRCSNENEATCSTRRKPPDRRPCRNKPCINHWFTLPWSSCSGMCGIRKRKVYCRDNQGRVVDDRKCDYNTKPLTVHACGHCQNKWVPQDWGECSVTCGGGVTTRRVVCGATSRGSFHIRPDSYCIEEARPPTTTRCRTAPCGAAWYTTEWSECSESCGTTGFRYRDVRCYGGPETEMCDANSRPEERERCQLPPCKKEMRCEDDGETQCHLVVSAKLCSHKYYRTACCQTCSSHH